MDNGHIVTDFTKRAKTDREYQAALAAGDVPAQVRFCSSFEMTTKEIVRSKVCFA